MEDVLSKQVLVTSVIKCVLIIASLQSVAVAFLSPIKSADISATVKFTKHHGDRFSSTLIRGKRSLRMKKHLHMSSLPTAEDLTQQKIDAIREYSRYHDGVWRGKRVTSFAINSDVAAGITKRIDAKDTTGVGVYKSFVRTSVESGGIRVQETFSWDEADEELALTTPQLPKDYEKDCEDNAATKTRSRVTSRSIDFSESVDIDSVDASYSLDSSPFLGIPAVITGTNAVIKFGIEHCISVSEHERVRCFLMYDMADKLSRVALCDEVRAENEVGETRLADDLLFPQLSFDEEVIAAENDVNAFMERLIPNDKDTLRSSSAAFTSNKNRIVNEEFNSVFPNERTESDSYTEERVEQLRKLLLNKNLEGKDSGTNETKLTRIPMSLFGIISGVWLGDCIVRNHIQITDKRVDLINSKVDSRLLFSGFAEWSLGVQKVAMTFKWDFEERVMQQYTSGRSLGEPISSLMPATSMGVLTNNDLARGRDPEDRIACVDFDMGMYVAFLSGSVYIKAPRSLSFSCSTGRVRPFFTEFAVFQKKNCAKSTFADALRNANTEESSFAAKHLNSPEIFCSAQTRLYGSDGRLQQGTSSFYNLDYMTNGP